MRIEYLNEVDSTNLYVKKYIEDGKNVIVCAKLQTGGMGTKGRSFISGDGGVYLTKLTFYKDMAAKDAFLVMAGAAAAVCKTASQFGVDAEIKWPNDVYVHGKKLCGILIENAISDGKLAYSIAGIGLNVENDLSGMDYAVSLTMAAGRNISADEARDVLIKNLSKPNDFGEYLSFIRFLNRAVEINENGTRYRAIARRVTQDGRLEVQTDEGVRLLSAAEINLKVSLPNG